MALRRRVGLLACVCLLLGSCSLVCAEAQDVNLQGTNLYNIGKWLTSNDADLLATLGWTYGGNPCTGWTGVECNAEGYVSAINLANKGLKGSLPAESSLWGGMTGLTTLDLAGNSLGGPVPSQIAAAGPQLASINLSDNIAICGTVPAGLKGLDSAGTSVGTDCAALAAATPAANTTAQDGGTAAGNATVETPAASNTTANGTSTATPTPATADNTTAAGQEPAAPPAPAAAPSPPPTVIANAPVCSCALKGFGSDDCAAAVKNTCAQASPPAVCKAGDPSSSEAAAEQLGQYLAQACFPGQNMDTSICNCVQNLLGNDCAKARVNLCVSKDPNCLPFQNIIDVNGSSSAEAVGKVAPVLDKQCPMVEPAVPGVKATMEFPDLSMGQYITRQYTQNVANALSSVSNVPSTSISTLDVRPFTGSASGRRSLLQSSGNGVQATYFLATQDPAGVSAKLSQAANDGTLSTKLSQYGIQAQAGGLKVQSFLPAPQGSSSASSSGFPLWAIGPIVGGVVLLGLAACLVWCCCLRKRGGKKAKEYAPDSKGSSTAGSSELPKSAFEYTPSGPGSYTPVTASAAGAGVGVAAAAAARSLPGKSDELPVSRSIKVTGGGPDSVASSNLTAWESNSSIGGGSSMTRVTAPPQAAGSNLAPVRTSSGNVEMAGVTAGAAAVGAGAAAAAGKAVDPATAASGWRSNVRPASGQLPATGGATSSMAATAGKSSQQAERAKFWAQFQETWQQVRQNQHIHDEEPGTPSSGTNWTDVTGTDPRR